MNVLWNAYVSSTGGCPNPSRSATQARPSRNVETKENVYYFATNIEPKGNRPENEYYGARIEVTIAALKALSIIR